MKEDYLETTVYRFKTYFSQYLRLLRRGTYRGIVIKHYKTPVAMLLPLNAKSHETKDD